tara:strand:+ start:369 stop:857 length:489 start_codon:yes stop_codon:yes gene_type:complete
MHDIRRNSKENQEKVSPYCPNKSKAAHTLSLMDRTERGETIEGCVADMIEEKTGYQATATIHNAAWDITVDIPDRPVRVEVKSSLLNSKNNYQFQGIKFENFDYLVVVFVTPRGTIEKWATKEDLQEFFSDKKRLVYGYTLGTTPHTIPDFFQEMEDFPYGN